MKKNFMTPILLIIILILTLIYLEPISNKLANMLDKKPTIIIKNKNKYSRNYDFNYVKITDNFEPYSYQELLNVFYTILDAGWDTFTFYCPNEYADCYNDINSLSENNEVITHINNFIHPFNSFSKIKTTIDQNGEVNIRVTKLYDENSINEINNKIDSVINEIITTDMTTKDKIKKFHDYIINNTTYDIEANETGTSKYESTSAYGTLLEGYAMCGGYSDAMALFLNRLNIKNYKIASDSHIWNAVYLEDNWYHLDLTWDDPVSKNGKEYVLYNYYLIDTDKLQELSTNDHYFNDTIYQELKN